MPQATGWNAMRVSVNTYIMLLFSDSRGHRAAAMHHISLRRIEIFVAVAESGSMSAAAAKLDIAQPSVSEHIIALEHSLGAVLLERRRGHPARLTAAGEQWLEQAKKLLLESNTLLAAVRAHQEQRRSTVVLATHALLSAHVVSSLLACFAQTHPEIEMVVQTGSPEASLAGLRDGSIDVAYFLSNRPLPGMHTRQVGWERYVFIAAPNHPLAGRRSIAPAELAKYDFIRGPANVMLSREVEDIFNEIGIGTVKAASRTGDSTLARNLVARGVGLHFTLEKSIREELQAGTLVCLDVSGPPTGIAVQEAVAPDRVLPANVRLCRAYVREHWPDQPGTRA